MYYILYIMWIIIDIVYTSYTIFFFSAGLHVLMVCA